MLDVVGGAVVTSDQMTVTGPGAGAGVRQSPACPGTGRHSVRYWHQSGAERLHMSQIQEAWIMNDSQIYKKYKVILFNIDGKSDCYLGKYKYNLSDVGHFAENLYCHLDQIEQF